MKLQRNQRRIIMVAGIALALMVVVVLVARTHYTPNSPAPTTPAATSTTQQGQIACLPPKGSGPHITICAIGLKTTSGSYYALKMNGHNPDYKFSQNGLEVRVTGALDTSAASDYDIAGTITVSDITAIK